MEKVFLAVVRNSPFYSQNVPPKKLLDVFAKICTLGVFGLPKILSLDYLQLLFPNASEIGGKKT